MTTTYDLTTDIGRMRRTIPDKNLTQAIWTDEELQSFLDDEGDWRRGSALALETAASNDLLIMKLVRINNVEVTGVDRAASQILKRADLLRKQADDVDANSGDSFDIIEVGWTDFAARERLSNEVMREG